MHGLFFYEQTDKLFWKNSLQKLDRGEAFVFTFQNLIFAARLHFYEKEIPAQVFLDFFSYITPANLFLYGNAS